MSKEALSLLKLTLDHELYGKYKGLFLDEMFPKPIDRLWEVIKSSHEEYQRTITEDEVLALVLAKNGVLTTAMKNNLGELLEEVKQLPNIGSDVAPEIIKSAFKSEMGRAIIEESYSLIEGREFDSGKLQSYIDQINNGYLPKGVNNIEFVPTDVEELLAQFDTTAAWKWNIEGLQEAIGDLQPGTFTVLFGRPECGKSAAAISLACAPNGFCEQGANVLFIYNEEHAKRQMLRAICSNTGLITDQIKENPKQATNEFRIHDRLRMVDGIGWCTEDVLSYCDKYNPDVVIIDQADKLKDFPKEDGHVRLEKLYIAIREIGKLKGCAVIGITQASVEAEGKANLDYSMMAGSRTAKAAECDLIIGIGVNSIMASTGAENENFRLLNLCKNKLSGRHIAVPAVLSPQISRLEDINKNQRK